MNTDLERTILGFRLSNEAKGLSNKTVVWYHQNLLQFHKWVQKDLGHPLMIEEITVDHLRRYFTELRTNEIAYKKHPFHPAEARPLSPRSILGYSIRITAETEEQFIPRVNIF